MNNQTMDTATALKSIQAAVESEKLSASAADNMTIWLTQSRYADYQEELLTHIVEQKWQKLDDVFWTIIPFGTGGRRGRMYPIGSNAINDRTIGESAQGLAEYVKEAKPQGPWSIAIAYDTRHRSREFAELCAGIMVANGFKVFFLDDYRSTPELSFLIRYKNCDCGIMVTASHNPPSDNAVKVYWSSGAQLVPPHDKAVIAKVAEVQGIEVSNFPEAVAKGQVEFCLAETDAALLNEHLKLSLSSERDIKIIYSPLHGVGEFNIRQLLERLGFAGFEVYERHQNPSGDFPNVPGHVSNPENAVVFDEIITQAQATGADLILATDPDADRMGAAAPLTLDTRGPWRTLNGNQLSALLCEYVLRRRRERGELTAESYVVTTLVTTLMLERICRDFDVRCFSDNLVGFKWICQKMDEIGPDDFVYGTEESHGFLVGQHCRDKDGVVACMLMAELAAEVRAQGLSLFQHMEQLYKKYGYHGERLITIQMEGSDGMRRMQDLMNGFRTQPPRSLGGLDVSVIRDYLKGTRTAGGVAEPMEGPQDNLIFMETSEPGNYVAARPSGTEPKVKFYMFTYAAPESFADTTTIQQAMDQRLAAFAVDLQRFADTIQ